MEKQFYLIIKGERVEVTEEVYRAYKRPVWNEKKKRQRNCRCRDGNSIRCNEDCNTCEYSRTHSGAQGSDISLEAYLETGADIVANADILDEIFERKRTKEIRKVIDSFDEADRLIAEMLGDGYKQNEIAEHLGITPVAVHKRLKKIRQSLKKFL